MVAELYEQDAMFWAKQGGIPWHGGVDGIGVEVEDGLTAVEALELKNRRGVSLNWTLDKKPLYSEETHGSGLKSYKKASVDGNGSYELIRSDNGRRIAYATEGYEVFQNREQAELVDGLLETGLLTIDTCGSLKNGKIVWFLAKIGESEVVPGDLVEQFILCYTAHDGSSSFRLLPTNVRVVCHNTSTEALRRGQGAGISIKHTKNMRNYIKPAIQALNWAIESSNESIEKYKQMAQIQMNTAQMTEFAKRVACFGISEKNIRDEQTGQLKNRIQNKVDQVLFKIHAGAGQRGDIAGVRGTAWAAFNGMTDWANNERSTDGKTDLARMENRLLSIVKGSSARLITDSTEYLLELAA